MPSRWQVILPGIPAASVRLEHLHAAVSGWLDDGDDEHRAQTKPYSVSPPISMPGGTAVEVGLMTEQAAARLRERVSPGTRVRLGSRWSTVAAAPHPIAGVPWQSLPPAGPPGRAWCLRFVSPTTFRRGNAFTPAPTLPAILGSLRQAWRRFAPAELGLALDLSAEPVWMTDIDVASQTTRVNDRVVSGFTGRLRFVCDADDQTAAAVDALVRLAEYTGVGAYTTRGFGMVRSEPTWSPAPPRRSPQPPHAGQPTAVG